MRLPHALAMAVLVPSVLLASGCRAPRQDTLRIAVIPKGAPHKDLAMKALALFIAPEQQALLPLHIAYGPINQKAFDQEVLTDELKAKVNSSPENAARQFVLDVAWWGEHGAEMMERWQNFKQQ